MKFCEKCGIEIWTKDGDNLCSDCENHDTISKAKRAYRNRARRERHATLVSLGLVRVRGALGGVYYE